jgi:two-component system sensor histidine kinase BaeS
LIALILGILLARTLTRPVNELTSATRAMARGDLEQQVPVRSQDELGELAISFNQMSSDLARANQSRRQMTADIAHDLRTPLTVIGGYAESMRDGVLKPTPERFDAIHTEVQHLQRLVEDLRTLSQADAKELSLNREPVAPAVLLERMAQSYRPLAAKQEISLKTKTEPGLPDLLADPDRLAQVFGNLISNSLRHTPQGGEIVLFAHGEDKDIVLGVQDSGSGIAPELLPHIFERFRRGDPSRQDGGSGLGLAIAKAIVELHGGTISAENNAGKGTTIIIKFPK